MPELATPVSPNGQLAGLSALYNRLPPQAQDGIAALVGLGGALLIINQLAPGTLGVGVLKWAAIASAIGNMLGIVSSGTRK